MTDQIEPVKPGDLINAEWMNEMIEKVNSLEGRVSGLEGVCTGPDKVVITRLLATWPLHVGDQLTVEGSNFVIPLSDNNVTVDNVRIDRFKSGSDESQLIFDVPPVSGLPKQVELIVSNQHGADSVTFVLQSEEQKPTGRLVISDETPDLGVITIGSPYTFLFGLDSQTTLPETYRLTDVFTDLVGTATEEDWSSSASLVDSTGSPLPTEYIRLDPGAPVVVGVHLSIPNGAESVNLTLRAQSMNNDAGLSTSYTIAIVVGEHQPVNDPRTSFSINDMGPLSQGRIVNVNGVDTIEIPYNGGTARVSITAQFAQGGPYNYSLDIEPEYAGIWSTSNFSPTESIEEDGGAQLIGVNLTLMAASDPTGSHAEKRFLILTASRTENDEVGQFSSWIRVPIRGYIP